MPLPALSACRGTPRTHAEPKLREGHPRTHGGIGAGIPCRRRGGRRATPAVRAHAVPPPAVPHPPPDRREGEPWRTRLGARCCTGAAAGGTSPLTRANPGAPLRSARRRPHSRGRAVLQRRGRRRRGRRATGGRAASGDNFALRRRASCAAAQDAPASAPRPRGRLRARARRQRGSGAERSVSCLSAGASGTCRGQRRRGAERWAAAKPGGCGAERAGLGLGPRPAPPLRPPGCESARLRITWRLPEAETREERKKKRLIPSSTAILYFIVTLIFIPPFYSRSWKVFLENEVRFGFLVNGR
ncbi:RNA-binding Raly-like protein isoform X2 [Agelaius tricolor]|uniref:RNA-binding Raly-like protein isoform X2 n=1 Tax=Agelaius tricolor TaxID=9191 RepID=UPI0039F1B118